MSEHVPLFVAGFLLLFLLFAGVEALGEFLERWVSQW